MANKWYIYIYRKFADNLIATIEAKKQNIIAAANDKKKRFLETLTTQKTEIENEIKIIESSLEKAEKYNPFLKDQKILKTS